MLNTQGRCDKTISTMSNQIGTEIEGTYLLTECLEVCDGEGVGRLHLQLHDATGSIRGVVWPESRTRVRVPALPCAVSIEARVHEYQSIPELKIRKLRPIDAEDVICASALLPLNQCPVGARAALQSLIALERAMPEPLAGFLRHVLLDPLIGIPLLRCRGSVRHHHAEVGGLLVHSTEPLDDIATAVFRALPDDPESIHLAQIGYLLHDLGKIRTVGEVCRPQYGLVVRHEFWTQQLLAPHLQWLEMRDQRAALGLSHILDFVSRSGSARTMACAEYLPAEVVVMFDQMSAAAFNRRNLDSLLRGSSRLQPVHRVERVELAANDPAPAREVYRAANR